MSRSTTGQSRRAVLCASALALALLACAVRPQLAQAVVGCRADPVVVLSDGTQLHLYATIDDASKDVRQVTFRLSVPHGTHVIAYTPGLLGPKQSLQVSSSGAADTYGAVTMVSTYTDGIAVKVSLEAGSLHGIKSTSASGYANQSIAASVQL